MKTLKSLIPNLITSLNLCFGAAAIVFAFARQPETAFWCIIIAAGCDFADGFSARLLNAYSEFGKQLDSLSDLISFGVAPAALVFVYFTDTADNGFPSWIAFNAFTVALFSAYRLARFNISPPSSDFRGLAVPASALYLISLICFGAGLPKPISEVVLSAPAVHIQVLIINLLMISSIPMFSLKFKNFNFTENLIRFIFLSVGVVLIAIFGIPGIWFVMVFYIFLSLATAIYHSKKTEL